VLLDMPRASEKAEQHKVLQVIFEGERKSTVGDRAKGGRACSFVGRAAATARRARGA
jgi:hypothetical protein